MPWNPEPPTTPDIKEPVCPECGHLEEDCQCEAEYCAECGVLLPCGVHNYCEICARERRRKIWCEYPQLTEKERIIEQDRMRRALERLSAVLGGAR
jgi:hypothetical protein